jgi:hypothetical protein
LGQIVYVILPTIGGHDNWAPERVKLEDFVTNGKTSFNVLKNWHKPPSSDAISNIARKIEPAETILYTLYGDIFRFLLPPELEIFKDSQTKMQVQITEEYLILLCSKLIFFIKLKDIDEQNDKQDFIVKDWELNKLAYVDVVHLEGRITAKVLDL